MTERADMLEFEAIGTHWWLERLDGGKFTDEIKSSLASYTAEFDRRYSRFRDDSLIMKLARDGHLANPPAEMLAMLEFSKELYEISDGAFNLSVGAALHKLGYGKRKHAGEIVPKFSDMVSWSGERVVVPKGLVLDFGGFGKGWLIDTYAELLRELGVKHYIVNGGGDLYVEADEPISFALEHPYDPQQKIGDIMIQKGALAASSTVKRVWKQGRKTLHHIIDPQTGKPTATGIVATFVCAHTALLADSLATVLVVRPDLEEHLEHRYNVETLLLDGGNVKRR